MIDGKQIKDGTIQWSKVDFTSLPVLTQEDKSKRPHAIGNQCPAGQISNTPDGNGYITVFRNGTLIELGNGVKTTDAYFATGGPWVEIHGSESSGVNALRADGTCWAWGKGESGQSGDGTTNDRSSPVSVVGNHLFVKIIGGYSSTTRWALKADGSAWGWGLGPVGDNTTQSRSSPVSVVGNHTFVAIGAVGSSASFGIKLDGTVWGCGVNTNGTLGTNETTNRSSPTSVIGNHSFRQITGAAQNVIALKADGTVWAWGLNTTGECGDNTITTRSSPVSVVGAHSFVFISGGQTQNHALKADGSCWGWGGGSFGRLGEASTAANRSSPVSVGGAHSFVAIYAGGAQCWGLKIDGTVWGWGGNFAGGLGDNTATSRSSPVSMLGNHSFIRIGGNLNTFYGIKEDGGMWASGSNNSGTAGQGACGDGTVINRSSPVSVLGNWTAGIVRNISDIQEGDIFTWNAVNAGKLTGFERIDFLYFV